MCPATQRPGHMSLKRGLPDQTLLQVSAHLPPDPPQAGSEVRGRSPGLLPSEPQSHQLASLPAGNSIRASPSQSRAPGRPRCMSPKRSSPVPGGRRTWIGEAGLKAGHQQGAVPGAQSSSPNPRTRTGWRRTPLWGHSLSFPLPPFVSALGTSSGHCTMLDPGPMSPDACNDPAVKRSPFRFTEGTRVR